MLFLNPTVLTLDLLFLIRGEVVLDVEHRPDLLGSLSPNHESNRLARQVKQRFVVQEVGGQNEFEKLVLWNLHKVGVPPSDFLTALLLHLLFRKRRVILVVLAVFNDLVKDRSRHVTERQAFVTLLKAVIVNHGGDGLVHLGNSIRHIAVLVITRLQLYGFRFIGGHGNEEEN